MSRASDVAGLTLGEPGLVTKLALVVMAWPSIGLPATPRSTYNATADLLLPVRLTLRVPPELARHQYAPRCVLAWNALSIRSIWVSVSPVLTVGGVHGEAESVEAITSSMSPAWVPAPAVAVTVV